MRSRPFLAALLGAALLCPSSRADDAGKSEAIELFEQGNKRAHDRDFAGALALFQSAYARYPNIKILLNIGTMLRQLGRNAEAADAYEAYAHDPAADPGKKTEVEKLLADLDTRVAKLRVEVDDLQAIVRVDSKAVGQSGGVVLLRVEPGPHVVSGARAGAPLVQTNVTAVAGQDARVSLHLTPPSPPAVPPPAPAPPPPTQPPVAATPVPGGPEAARSPVLSLAHGGQFGVVVRADVDGQAPGIVPAVGLSYGIGDYVDVAACALLGRTRGVEPGATVLLLRGAWKPRISAAVPIFFMDGPRPGVRVSAGLQWDPIRRIGVFLDAGVAAFPNAPEGYRKVVFVPALGIQPRL